MIVERRQNGYGLRYGAQFNDAAPPAYEPWFDDSGRYVGEVVSSGSMVLSGEPGAGKSHITQDVLRGSYDIGKAVCMVSCHINSGSSLGRDFTQETFRTAADIGSDCLVVVDNLDYLVYTGAVKRRRTNSKVEQFAEFMLGEIAHMRDSGCAIFATTHTQLWRENHSDAPIHVWKAYEAAVDALGGERTFTGAISKDNAQRLLKMRGIDQIAAAAVAEDLHSVGGLFFRQAHHLSIDTYNDKGIIAAVAEVESLKQQKIDGGA